MALHIGKQHKSSVPAYSNRQDGYSDYNAKLVCAFQSSVERTTSCDYEALRHTLAWARSIDSYKLTPVGVRAHYEDQRIGWLYQ